MGWTFQSSGAGVKKAKGESAKSSMAWSDTNFVFWMILTWCIPQEMFAVRRGMSSSPSDILVGSVNDLVLAGLCVSENAGE